jgi:hypothetical protein
LLDFQRRLQQRQRPRHPGGRHPQLPSRFRRFPVHRLHESGDAASFFQRSQLLPLFVDDDLAMELLALAERLSAKNRRNRSFLQAFGDPEPTRTVDATVAFCFSDGQNDGDLKAERLDAERQRRIFALVEVLTDVVGFVVFNLLNQRVEHSFVVIHGKILLYPTRGAPEALKSLVGSLPTAEEPVRQGEQHGREHVDISLREGFSPSGKNARTNVAMISASSHIARLLGRRVRRMTA